jgi:hypothetical protein
LGFQLLPVCKSCWTNVEFHVSKKSEARWKMPSKAETPLRTSYRPEGGQDSSQCGPEPTQTVNKANLRGSQYRPRQHHRTIRTPRLSTSNQGAILGRHGVPPATRAHTLIPTTPTKHTCPLRPFHGQATRCRQRSSLGRARSRPMTHLTLAI